MSFPYYNDDGTKSENAWKAGEFYGVGKVVRASPQKSHTLAFRCIVAGTSGDTEPAFPRQITETVQDNGITWEAFEPLAEQLLALAPTAVIDLFEVVLTKAVNTSDRVVWPFSEEEETLRYHAGTNDLLSTIRFNKQLYPAVPVEVDGFSFSSQGTLPRPTLKVANANNAISTLLRQCNPLHAQVRRIRTFAKFLDTENFNRTQSSETEDSNTVTTQGGDNVVYQGTNDTADPDAKIIETWYIDRVSSENLQFVEFELVARLDLTNLLLPRRTVSEFCPWKYRQEECGYVGDACFTVDDRQLPPVPESFPQDVCGKRLSSCKLRFPERVRTDDPESLPFGGFPGARLQA